MGIALPLSTVSFFWFVATHVSLSIFIHKEYPCLYTHAFGESRKHACWDAKGT